MAEKNKYTPIVEGINDGLYLAFVLFVLVFAVCVIIVHFGV